MEPQLTLILGGARSGKSRLGETRAEASGLAPHYLATAEARDNEMGSRIAQHRARRDDRWTTHEVPLELAAVLTRESAPDRILLVDCLTLWLSNIMLGEVDLQAECGRLLAVLAERKGPVILIANEVGLGIVPDNALARDYRDAAGRLNQDIAAICDTVIFVAAGLPVFLKQTDAGTESVITDGP